MTTIKSLSLLSYWCPFSLKTWSPSLSSAFYVWFCFYSMEMKNDAIPLTLAYFLVFYTRSMTCHQSQYSPNICLRLCYIKWEKSKQLPFFFLVFFRQNSRHTFFVSKMIPNNYFINCSSWRDYIKNICHFTCQKRTIASQLQEENNVYQCSQI